MQASSHFPLILEACSRAEAVELKKAAPDPVHGDLLGSREGREYGSLRRGWEESRTG